MTSRLRSALRRVWPLFAGGLFACVVIVADPPLEARAGVTNGICIPSTLSYTPTWYPQCTAAGEMKVTGTFTPSGTQNVNLTQVNGSSIALGQTTMSASLPVAIASDQAAISVKQPYGSSAAQTLTANSFVGILGTNGTTGDPLKDVNAGQLETTLYDAAGNALLGSQTSARSVPVVIASDQAGVSIKQAYTTGTGQTAAANSFTGMAAQDSGASTVSALIASTAPGFGGSSGKLGLWSNAQVLGYNGSIYEPIGIENGAQGVVRVAPGGSARNILTSGSATACTNLEAVSSNKIGHLVAVINSGPATVVFPQFYDDAGATCASSTLLYGDGATITIGAGQVVTLNIPVTSGIAYKLSGALTNNLIITRD